MILIVLTKKILLIILFIIKNYEKIIIGKIKISVY